MGGDNLPSVQCLKAFKGDYVVHVGELFGCTWSASQVWGKTTSMAFQVELQTHFHRVYQHELPRFPLFRDTLTIWKRNKTASIGQERILCLQPEMCADNFQTRGWDSWFKGRIKKKRRVDPGFADKNACRLGSVLRKRN